MIPETRINIFVSTAKHRGIYEGCPRKSCTSVVTGKVMNTLNWYFHVFTTDYLCTSLQNIIH